MSNIRIIHSNDITSDKIIYDLMKIEANVFAPEYRGEYGPICRRFHKFKDMFVLAYDGDKVVGYLCYFPISGRLHHEILHQEGFHDDDISPDDVVEMSKKNNIYFLSIALYKAYQGKGIGKAMADAFFRKLRERNANGNEIEDIIASVVTKQGEHLIKKYGFSLISDYSESARYKVYRKEGKDI